jgi:hypothetical protein
MKKQTDGEPQADYAPVVRRLKVSVCDEGNNTSVRIPLAWSRAKAPVPEVTVKWNCPGRAA